jgi:hypothetical protein
MAGTWKRKAGYRKLQFCSKQAENDGLHFFWVDSCCIDKSSSAELSEAINSMYRWHRGAKKCYVYLTDVGKDDTDLINSSAQLPPKSAFRTSRWFTRGWTLQELLAPLSVEFFSQDGERLGDKKSLESLIHDITGIATQALGGDSLSRFSVDERMSWVTKRETTLEEDKAYSLLGIFDIHMPLIYGEGEQNAFFRLKEEIKKRQNTADGEQYSSVCIENNQAAIQTDNSKISLSLEQRPSSNVNSSEQKLITTRDDRTTHNLTGKRYRKNVKMHLEALREAVPALGHFCEPIPNAIEELQAKQPTKSAIISAATAYIKQLEKENEGLKTVTSATTPYMKHLEVENASLRKELVLVKHSVVENKRFQQEAALLRQQVRALQAQVKCDDCSLMQYVMGLHLREDTSVEQQANNVSTSMDLNNIPGHAVLDGSCTLE